jgi:hypothetical protein
VAASRSNSNPQHQQEIDEVLAWDDDDDTWLVEQPLSADDLALLETELDQVVAELSQIQTELRYQQSQETLRDFLQRLDLSPREQMGLEKEIVGLEKMLYRLEQMTLQIAVFGMVGRGKSSVLNALLGQSLFETGPLHGVTRSVQRACWQQKQVVPTEETGLMRLTVTEPGQSSIEVVDTPGLDEVDGDTRQQMAQELAKQADLLLFVVSGDMTHLECEAFTTLHQTGKPMILVFNKVDQYSPADRETIYATLRDRRVQGILAPQNIVMTAADPVVTEAHPQEDGEWLTRTGRGTPQVDDLKLKILEILQREGKALVALNSMLYAREVNDKVVRRKLSIRDRAARDLIWQSTLTKAIAVALNPVTVADVLGGMVVDVAMVAGLSRLYGIPMTTQGITGLLRTILLGMGGISASGLLTSLGLGSIKSLLGLSAAPTGGLSLAPYVPVALTQGAIAGLACYAVGHIAREYLANGASWGEDSPQEVIARILDSLDETSILTRIKHELQFRLNRG